MKLTLAHYMLHLPIFVAALFLAVSASGITPEELTALVTRSPQPAATDYRSATENGSTVVALGTNGTVVVSRDSGTSWVAAPRIPVSANGTGNFPSPSVITNDGTRYVAVSANSYAVSTDLQAWITGRINGGAGAGITFGNNRFVTISGSGAIQRSINGETWTPATSIPSDPNGLRFSDITFGNGAFAISANAGRILRSTDGGNTWEFTLNGIPGVTGRESDFTDISFANGLFIATGFGNLFYTSADAATWTRRDVPLEVTESSGGLAAAAHDGTNYVFSTQFSSSVTSTNLIDFTLLRFESNGSADALLSAEGTIIAAGRNSFLASFDNGNWIERFDSIGDSFSGAAFGNDLFVIADSSPGTIYTSTTGVVWTFTYDAADDRNFRSAPAFGNGRFVIMIGNDRAATSTDGLTWSEVEHLGQITVDALTFLNGRFFAFGRRGSLISSIDGTTWIEHDIGDNDFWVEDIAFGNGLYVLAGKSTNVLTSTDLTTWTPRPTTSSADYVGIEFIGDRFLAFESRSSEISVSSDGISWSREAIAGGTFIQPLGSNGGIFTDPDLGIYYTGRSNSIAHFSNPSDLSELTITPVPSGSTIHSIVEGNGIIVAAGASGLILSTSRDSAGYEGWVSLNFPLGSARTSPGDDFDFDGQLNLIEYARGTSPTNATPAFLVPPTQTAFGPEIIWTQSATVSDVSAEAEYSTDLTNWFNMGVLQETSPLASGMEQITARVTGEAGLQSPLYIRIRWTLQ